MQPIPRSSSDVSFVGICAWLLAAVALLSFFAGCASSRRQRDYARLYRVAPGEEREDFARLASWIADHDGQISLPVGGTLYWAETAYYRWYSNETFVIVTCPPRFHETRSFVRWVSGSVRPVARGVGWSLSGDYGLRGPGTYDFPGITMRPEHAEQDGAFGARFGDKREQLMTLLRWHVSDQPPNNQGAMAGVNKNPAYDRVAFGWLRGCPKVQMSLFLSPDRRVGIISIRMDNSPSLAGLDFMKEDPPVLRQGSFVVDESLAEKGMRRRPNLSPRRVLGDTSPRGQAN
jgi:hypothetical protein